MKRRGMNSVGLDPKVPKGQAVREISLKWLGGDQEICWIKEEATLPKDPGLLKGGK